MLPINFPFLGTFQGSHWSSFFLNRVYLSSRYRMKVSSNVSKALLAREMIYLCLILTCTCMHRNALQFLANR